MKSGKRTIILIVSLTFLIFGSTTEDPYLFPIRPGQQNFLTGSMGELRRTHFHGGIDIKTGHETGWPVYAAADGYVSRIKVKENGYGNALYITHPELGTTTVYGHLERFSDDVAAFLLSEQYASQQFAVDLFPDKNIFPIKKGELVAYSGNSGSSGGPHLHFEIRDEKQRPINPLYYGFKEIKDAIAPTVQKISLKALDKESRVKDQFGVFEFTPYRSGNRYKVQQPIEVYGKIGIMLMGFDKTDGTSNRYGIPHLHLKIDGREVLEIEIDKVPFNKNRQIYGYRDNYLKQENNRSYQKLFIDDGIDLQIYNNNENKGIISVYDSLSHDIEITLTDAYNNSSYVEFTLAGKKPEMSLLTNPKYMEIVKGDVIDNTMIFMAKKAENNGYYATVHSGLFKYEIGTSYYINDHSVYLWDLRNGLPDSIVTCEEVIYPEVEMMIPSESEFIYYQPMFDVKFPNKSLFDTLFMVSDYKLEASENKEYFKISDPVYPLKRAIEVQLKPALSYKNREKVAAYYTNNYKSFWYQGGQWSEDEVFEFNTNELGTYTLLEDTIPPSLRIIQKNRDRITFYSRDNLSGIKDFHLTINNEWVLVYYDQKRNYFWTEKLDKNKPFKGEVKLSVTDMVNNEKMYTSTIY